ncbi:hypothetical protein [Halpernia sp. GG3]
MKNIEIKAAPFFELLKLKGESMWDIFSQMIDGEEKLLLFSDNDDQLLFEYLLPKDVEQLKTDQKRFSHEYAEKIANLT